MSKIIIGIHGLANKPDEATLTDYWRKSIAEGLRHAKARDPSFNFELVCWSKYLYRNHMHEDENFKFDNLYNNEPYLEATDLRPYDEGWKDEIRYRAGSAVGPGLEWFKRKFGIDRLADGILGAKLKDLDYYYQELPVQADDGTSQSAKVVLRQALVNALEANKDNDIMLISHSMGTIIAYDVLRALSHTGHEGRVKHFVTMGSPLGLPHVKQKIIEEREAEGRPEAATLRTPTIVTDTWMNFSDKSDPVALDAHLKDDYKPNNHGVQVADDLVMNDYKGRTGNPNHHKSYGYLRTPEFSRHLKAFLEA